MAWVNVEIDVDGKSVPNVVQIDAIVRYGPRPQGSYIKFIDGSSVNLLDSFESITQVILQAQGK